MGSTADQVRQEENSPRAKVQIAAAKKLFQENLQKLQTARTSAQQQLQQSQESLKACQDAATRVQEKIQQAKEAKEIALSTTCAQFHQVGKDLVEAVELDKQEFGRDQRIFEATTKIEQIAFARKQAILAREQAVTAKVASEAAKGGERNAWNRVAFKLEQSSKSWDKVSEALTRGKQDIASLWRKAAEKDNACSKEFEQVALAHAEGDKEKAKRLYFISLITYNLSNADRFMAEAEGALEKGHQDIAEFWRKAAIAAQEAAEHWKQAIQAHELGDTKQFELARAFGGSPESPEFSIADGLSKGAEYLTKAAKAKDEEKQEIATLWTKGAEQMKAVVECEQKVLQSVKLEKKKSCELWGNITKFYENSTKRLELTGSALEKATVAIAKGNQSLANLYNKIALQYQESGDYYRKDVEAQLNGNNGEANRCNDIAKFYESSVSHLESAVSALESAVSALEKATAATAKGNQSLADCWSKIALQEQEAAEYYQKAAEAELNGNDAEADRWRKIAAFSQNSTDRLKSVVEPLEEASTATAKGNQSLADLWSKIALQYQESADHYQKVVEAKLNRNDVEANRCEKIAGFSTNRLYTLELAVEPLEEASAAIVKGNNALAELWSKTALQCQELVEYYRKAVKLSGNDAEAERLNNNIVCSSRFSHYRYCLFFAINVLNKATDATANGNQSLAEFWNKLAAQRHTLAEHHFKILEAKLSGNNVEADRWNKIARFSTKSIDKFESAAEALEEATDATASGSHFLAGFWNKSAALYQASSEHYQKAAEAKISGNDAEADLWKKIAASKECFNKLKSASKALDKATSSTDLENKPLADLWSKVAALYQESAGYYQKSKEAKLSGNDSEADRWKNIANIIVRLSINHLKLAASALEKATTATAKGNVPLAELWNKVADQHQKSTEHSQKVVEAKLSGNGIEAGRWEKITSFLQGNANHLELAAEALEKAMIATDSGNQSLAELWNKTAVQYQELAEYSRKFGEAKLNANDPEAERWKEIVCSAKNSGKSLRLVVSALEKVTDAIAKGTNALGELWSKRANQYQEAAEHYRKAAEAKLSGNDSEAERWNKIADSSKESADSLESTVKALEQEAAAIAKGNQSVAKALEKATAATASGNTSLADLWNKIADSSKRSADKLDSLAKTFEKIQPAEAAVVAVNAEVYFPFIEEFVHKIEADFCHRFDRKCIAVSDEIDKCNYLASLIAESAVKRAYLAAMVTAIKAAIDTAVAIPNAETSMYTVVRTAAASAYATAYIKDLNDTALSILSDLSISERAQIISIASTKAYAAFPANANEANDGNTVLDVVDSVVRIAFTTASTIAVERDFKFSAAAVWDALSTLSESSMLPPISLLKFAAVTAQHH